MFLASHERGVPDALLAAGLVAVMLLVVFDLDRSHRGTITIPDGPIVAVRQSMNAPPAESGPSYRPDAVVENGLRCPSRWSVLPVLAAVSRREPVVPGA